MVFLDPMVLDGPNGLDGPDGPESGTKPSSRMKQKSLEYGTDGLKSLEYGTEHELIQGGITIPDSGTDSGRLKSSFPHIVEWNGALSAEDEGCAGQQQNTKLTKLRVRLLDGQGAPPPSSCPHWLVPAPKLPHTSVSY